MEFARLYAEMFSAQKFGRVAEAAALKCQIENLRLRSSERPSLPDLGELPEYVRRKLGLSDTGNCINAAFNFHFTPERDDPITPSEFLVGLQRWFRQIDLRQSWCCGDLLVYWSRQGGSWDDRRIQVSAMSNQDPDFPYGLVFDHVAVRIDAVTAFHKPDPTSESLYRFDYLSAIALPTRTNRGFEITIHRRLGGSENSTFAHPPTWR